ncbi:MAG: outer membrane beta-barrel protein [Verrucomicrobiales bacterium]|nr:outer membrane beta-barrel protein [Verrucomicrobiales bacterium]
MKQSPLNPKSVRTLAWGAAVAALPLLAQAQFPNYFAPGGGDRAGSWETYVALGGMSPRGIAYQNVGGTTDAVDVSVDTFFRGGVGVGYNINQFWNVNFELTVGAPDFQATGSVLGDTVSDTVYIGTGKLNLDWNILPGNITPLVTGGVGFVTLTVNDPNSGIVCYPDYWWGTVCYDQTQTEAAFTWNVGAGLRANFKYGIFVKAVAGVEWWLLDGANGVPYSIFGTLAVGMSFK